jgi:hypothetical protein
VGYPRGGTSTPNHAVCSVSTARVLYEYRTCSCSCGRARTLWATIRVNLVEDPTVHWVSLLEDGYGVYCKYVQVQNEYSKPTLLVLVLVQVLACTSTLQSFLTALDQLRRTFQQPSFHRVSVLGTHTSACTSTSLICPHVATYFH